MLDDGKWQAYMAALRAKWAKAPLAGKGKNTPIFGGIVTEAYWGQLRMHMGRQR